MSFILQQLEEVFHNEDFHNFFSIVKIYNRRQMIVAEVVTAEHCYRLWRLSLALHLLLVDSK